MSKLTTVNPRMTALTLCPGNVLYMSPEALDEAKAKLDIFSFGVIVIQILTRQFPNPTDRFHLVSVPQFEEAVRVLVPETERRGAHLKLIPDTHSLKPLALRCLTKKEYERPSALQLSDKLSELKQSSQYTGSLQSSSDIQQLQQQLRGQRILTEAKLREVQENQTRITELQCMVEDKNRQVQENQAVIQAKDTQLQECQHVIASRENTEGELQQTQGQLRASEQLVSEFQQSLQQKNKTITDLQQTISAHDGKILQLKQQDTASRDQPQQKPVMASAQKDISKMIWRKGKNAPEKMTRGAAVVHGNTAYFRPGDSRKVFSYQYIQEQWPQIPDNPNMAFGLAVIDGLLTSVGGYNHDYTNTLLTLTGEGMRKQWSEIFPSMPTRRETPACITIEQCLVVAGGFRDGSYLDIVEVMNINTKQWTTVSPLPQKQSALSATVCGDTLYLAGGWNNSSISKSVFTCSLTDLLTSPNSLGSKIRRTLVLSQGQNVWKEISSLPVKGSTLASFNGQLLAIGGEDYSENPTTNVYRYDSHTNSWNVISQRQNKRSLCLAVTLPEALLLVVGGYNFKNSILETVTDSVEILK